MRNLKLIIIVSFCLILGIAPTTLAGVEFTEDLFMNLAHSVNDVPYIESPAYLKSVLPNGMTVYLVEDDSLPIVEMHGYILGGRSQEAIELPGVSDLMVQMMNTGTASMGELEFSRYKEVHGLDFNLSVANDYLLFSGNALSVDQAQLITLAADVLQNPNFSASYFTRKIQELYQLLSYSFYRDDLLLDIFFNTTLYGAHPYANGMNVLALLQVLPAITPEHLQQHYNQTIDPAHVIMTIVGDLNAQEMLAELNEKFGTWESKGLTLTQPQVVVNEANFNQIMLINKPDATHVKMKMGYNFYDTSFSDKNAFLMADMVFGSGSFASRLMDTLRTERGYVYGVYSATQYNQLGGIYYITTDVAPEKTLETMEIIKEQMVGIKEHEAPITEQELFANINYYNAFFPQAYQHKINVMAELIYNVEVLGKNENSINEFIAEYNALTAAVAQDVYSKHVYPERFLTVIVGNKEHVLPAFLEQGIDVGVIDLF
jgi:zinc protease